MTPPAQPPERVTLYVCPECASRQVWRYDVEMSGPPWCSGGRLPDSPLTHTRTECAPVEYVRAQEPDPTPVASSADHPTDAGSGLDPDPGAVERLREVAALLRRRAATRACVDGPHDRMCSVAWLRAAAKDIEAALEGGRAE